MRVRFGRLGNFRRTFTLDIFNTINIWRHYDVVISNIGQVDIYIDNILQTYIATGAVITLLRLFTATNLTTNLLQIYANTCYLSDFKIFLKSTIAETIIDDLTLALLDRDAEYLLYDNKDTSGNNYHLDGTIIEQGRDIDGKQWLRRGQLISVIPTISSRVSICSITGGTGLTISLDIKLFQTGTNQSSSVLGFGTQINTGYATSSTNTSGSGLFLRILNSNKCQLLICDANASYTFFVTSPDLSATKWTNLVFQIPSSNSKVQIKLWVDGVSIPVSTNTVNTSLVIGTVTSDINRFIITGNNTDSPYLSNIKIWLTDTITSSDIVNRRLDQVDPPLSIAIVKQSQKYVDFRVCTINNSYMNFLNNSYNLLIRASLISKQNVLLSGAIDLNTISIPPTAFFKGSLLALYDIIGNLPSPTTTAFAVIFPNTTYLQVIKFEKFTVNNNANVQFPIRDLNRFDVKDYSFSYIYINDTIVPYSYDLILSIGFSAFLDSPMPSELEFIRGLSFDFQNISGTTVNVDIGTFNTSTGLDYLTIENVTYTLGGFTRFDFTISKTRLLTVYINGKSASVQLTKPINIVGKYNIKLHQRKYTSGESFTNVKMWRKCVSSNRLAIEHLNYNKEYKTLAPYIRPVKPITILYKSGVGLDNTVIGANNLVLRTGSSYFATPYNENATGANSREDGATLDVVVPLNTYSMRIYLTCSDSVAFGHLLSFGDPNQSLTIGQSSFTIIFDILITSQFEGATLKADIGGVSSFFNFILKGLASLGDFAKAINDSIKKQFTTPPFVASNNGTKIGFNKPTGGSDVKIYPDGAGKDLGINLPIYIVEPAVIYYSQLPPTFVNETINRSMTISRQTSAGLANTINFRYNSNTAQPIYIIFYSAGLPRAWLGINELSSEIVDTVTSFVEYRFNTDFKDISGRDATLSRSGTGTVNTLYSDSTLGTGYGYIKVLSPYRLFGNIAPTNTFISIASKLSGASGMRVLFKIKLNNSNSSNNAIFSIGKRPRSSFSSGAGNLSRGLMFRLFSNNLSYLFIDANGNFTQLLGVSNITLSTTAWTSVEIVINRLIGTDNKILIDMYFNGTKADITAGATTTGYDMSYSGGVDNNLLDFTGYNDAHNIADFKIYLSNNRTARTTVNPLNFGGSMPLVTNTGKLHLGVINNSITNAVNKTWISYPSKVESMTVVTSTEDLEREDMLNL